MREAGVLTTTRLASSPELTVADPEPLARSTYRVAPELVLRIARVAVKGLLAVTLAVTVVPVVLSGITKWKNHRGQ